MLTEGQQKALDDMLIHYQGPKTVGLLQGSAGTGKTFLMDSLIGKLKGRVLCSAPTHKAVAVLRDKVRNPCEFKTVHAALSYKMSYNSKGQRVFMPKPHPKYPPLKYVDFWVIDEASMIGKDMLEHILYWGKESQTHILFVGDAKQLPPVKEKDSSVFTSEFTTFNLTEIVRQGPDNPIIDLSRNLHWLNNRTNCFIDGHGYIFAKNYNKILEELAEVNGSDEFKFLAFTNRTVDNVNRQVRQRIYNNPNKIELGESIVFNAPYGEEYHTNQELRVKELKKSKQKFSVTVENHRDPEEVELSYYVINPDDNEVFVVSEESEKTLSKIKKDLKRNAKAGILSWPDYYEFLDIFADYKYNHALTIHKS